MATTASNPHLSDRSDDPRACAVLAEKPPVLGRRAIQLLSAACLLVIVYGTIGPLRNFDAPWLATPDTWSWIPPQDATSRHDVITNFMVYIPVGIAFRLLFRRRGSAGAADFIVGLTCAAGLSYLTEVGQQFMPSRSANVIDCYVNGAGALLGVLLAPAAQRGLRRLHAATFRELRVRPWNVLRLALGGTIVILMTVPWDLARPSIELEWWRSFDWLDSRRWGLFALFAFASTIAQYQLLRRLDHAVGKTIEHVFIMAAFLEGAQVFLGSHACALLDIATAWAGGLLGCGAARGWLVYAGKVADEDAVARSAWRVAPTGPRRILAIIVLAQALLIAPWLELHAGPGAIGEGFRGSFIAVPFQTLFSRSFDSVVTYVVEVGGLYALICALGLYLTYGRGRRATLLLVTGLALLSELLRLALRGGAADVSTFVVAIGVWFVTLRVWDAYFAWLATRSTSGNGPRVGLA